MKTGDSLGAKVLSGAPLAGGGVVVEVREKKGPLRAAIPTMPFPVAVICLFLNTFIPGLGELDVSSLWLPAQMFTRRSVKLFVMNKRTHRAGEESVRPTQFRP